MSLKKKKKKKTDDKKWLACEVFLPVSNVIQGDHEQANGFYLSGIHAKVHV